MARHNIKSLKSHPERDQLNYEYQINPSGEFLARLDYQAWGQSANLLCYFTDLATGYPFRLSVWYNKDYRPCSGGPAFDKEPPGGVFRVMVGQTSNGLPTFDAAERVEIPPAAIG